MVTGTGEYLVGRNTNPVYEKVQIAPDQMGTVPVVQVGNSALEGVASGTTVGNAWKDEFNSTSTLLLANTTFSGTAVNVTEIAEITVSMQADVVSATDGIEVQFSTDGVNDWHIGENWEYDNANAFKTWKTQRVDQYYRVVYKNGASDQTHFHLTTIISKVTGVQWSHRIKDDISGQDDAGLVKSILAAERAGGTPDVYTNIQATSAGNLKISIEEVNDGNVVFSVEPSDNLSISEFGEQRVANPGNRFDVEFLYDKQPLLVDDISSGTGLTTHNVNSRDVVLSVGGSGTWSTGGLRAHYWTPYTPGSGQEIDITGTLDLAGIGGGTMYTFLRTTISGVTTLAHQNAQATWSAVTSGVDWSNSQIFRVSFQSLKVGRVQFALVQDGIPIKVDEVLNDNVRDSGYWQYAALPPYWKVYNDGTNTIAEIGYGDELNGVGFMYVFDGLQASATTRAICATVKSQGGLPLFEMPGYPFITPILTAKTVSTTLIPILSIRVSPTFNSLLNRSLIIPTDYDINTDNPIDYSLLFRPSLTGASWQDVDATYSGVQYDNTASAVSGGIEIGGGYLSAGRNDPISGGSVLGRILMSLGSTGTGDILTLAAIRDGANNASIKSRIKWKEIR